MKETREARRARKLAEKGITRFWPVPMVPLRRATTEGTVTVHTLETTKAGLECAGPPKLVRGQLRRAR